MNKYINKLLYVAIILIFTNSCETQITSAQQKIVRVFPNVVIPNPVDIQSPIDGTDRLFFVSQIGKIFVIKNSDTATAKLFLDIESKVLSGGEQGLLGLAFHPNFNFNKYFYVNYTTDNPRRTIISKFSISNNDKNSADINSEEIILEVEQPYSNHNGGQISFGPDGYLYVSFGDGGSGGDPLKNGQNLSTLLGSIIRINVDSYENGKIYSIPDDNPFKGNTKNFREEIYAYGLRNVWRFSFDSLGNLWAADVGQNKWEEINIIIKGANYGWNIMEGNHCYSPSSGCDQTNLDLPIWEYGHDDLGGYSITGGYVYERNDIPSLSGKYVYGDFVSRNIWALDMSNKTKPNELIAQVSFPISTFGLDENKFLYIADYSNGRIYKFISDSVNSVGSLIPNTYKLNQNFPNPFNNTTEIKYFIPNGGFSDNLVNLSIYNSIGEKIKTLVNELQEPGEYKVVFDGRNLVSGTYFFRLVTNEYDEVKKMTLLK